MTKKSIALNRTLFLEDNLPVLRGLDSESVDLIATDPPFNKGVGAFEGTTKAGVGVGFKDVWHWGDVHGDWTASIFKDHPRLYNVIQTANTAAGDDMGAFLCWMSVRVLEMHRVLKPTGSIYLHCDPTASHYSKAMLDTIFGRKQFRNEIVWAYTGPSNTKRWFPRKHDTIMFYAKSDKAIFNWKDVRVPYKKLETGKTSGIFKSAATLDSKGKVVEDWWHNISPVGRIAKERAGYPTQKPLALYKRMIQASSNPGDIVLDPFVGCATTCVGAEQLGRQWIAIDIQVKAEAVILERLQAEVDASMAWGNIVNVLTLPPTRTDDGATVAPELILHPSKHNEPRMSAREVRDRLIEDDDGRMFCWGCGYAAPRPEYLQIDHKRPRSLGGKDVLSNFALLCAPCNGKKSNKLTLQDLQNARRAEGWMDMEWWEKWGRWK